MKMRKMLSTAAAAALAAGVVGCSDGNEKGDSSVKEIAFAAISVPTDDAGKAEVRAANEATVNGETKAIGFHTIVRTGQVFNSGTFGQLFDIHGNKLQEADGSDWICTNGSGPDHTTLLEYGSSKYAVTQLECGVGGAYVTKLDQDENGLLSAVDTKAADFSQVRGTYVNCAGMKTPWGTHLGTEEYEPFMSTGYIDSADGKYKVAMYDNKLDAIVAYHGLERSQLSNAQLMTMGYYYGWFWELTITGENMESTVTKHYAMGRAAWEQAYVLPDRRTAYMGDDGTNGAFWMFVADSAEAMDAGHLYAAKWQQTSSAGAGAADLGWIDLGHATSAQIDAALSAGITFDDMFERADYNDGCEAGFTPINESAGAQCVRLKAGTFAGTPIATLASRLEARVYAAYLGATTEFRKEEGVTFNAAQNTLYVAMSQVTKGMEDGSSQDTGGNNDIRLGKNSCGAVYQLEVKSGVRDTSGSTINSAYVAYNMQGLVAGIGVDYTGTVYEGNTCDINGISNPDNLSYLEGYNTLLIGEDTDGHPNDFIWSYNFESGELTRILTAPYGAETTSPFWHKDFGGYGYITTVIQHPFGEIGSGDPDYSIGASASDTDKESYVGYIGPFPKL